MFIYFNLFGKISAGLYKDAVDDQNSESFFADKKCYVLIVSAFIGFFIYFRQIKELKILSITLFFCIIVMTVALIT
jgi:amino acid permease